ncbi:FAD-dependent oxidoreductase [Cryptosporangium aurantiacum]|uniref:Glycine/D-amino acid oxidase n=1 Tax=Cryptosporangium aurantiacum TaxID=134849 RepID=A0A1M7RI20_9ACTN|nr:FAD-dependent oxidoreductase [Cryptosporangium aurantiacum]SHN45812.1 Glycine/D-amino acid oxidase [Cryptosporangium aurantiacum]
MRIGVIGAGIVGLSTAYALRRYPVSVRCYESGAPMGGRSRGGTRIFRLAHGTPALVRYAARARTGWRRWERTAGRTLVGAESTVVSGVGADEWYAAMRSAGVRCGLYADVADVPGLPARPGTPGPFLVDPAGGVIRAEATGEFLTAAVRRSVHVDAVRRITVHGDTATIHSTGGSWQCDSVLIAAGTGTAALAAPLGLPVPAALEHHVRFTFPLVATAGPDGGALPPPRCWIERSGAWKDGFTTYGHLAAPGQWAIGGHLPEEDTAWEIGPDEARRRAEPVVTGYVAEFLGDVVDPTPVDTVYCAVTPELGDGIQVARAGPVLAVWGENLFKFAPALGADLAAAVASRGLPDDLP